jgi:hypothetical protein
MEIGLTDVSKRTGAAVSAAIDLCFDFNNNRG